VAGANRQGQKIKMTPGSDTAAKVKAALRAEMRAKLREISQAERDAASIQACALLKQQAIWQNANSILFYAPMPDELDVWPLVAEARAAGKSVLLPRFDPEQNSYVACHIHDLDKDIRIGQFDIREANSSCAINSLKRLDLILVPGIAFDLSGRRLGRGKGFYDQLLAKVAGLTCGVAFDQQIVGRIPVESHDIRLSCILTPTRWHCPADPRVVLK
jgi:5-formyltetrahydrofolate cyclo-ligase